MFCRICGKILTPQVGATSVSGGYVCNDCLIPYKQARVNASDTSSNYLENKLVAGSSKLSITSIDAAGDASLSFDVIPAQITLSQLGNVSASSPSDGQVLGYQTSSSKWVNTTSAGGGSGAPTDSSYITTASEASLSNETLHSALTGANLHDPKAHASSHQNTGSDEINVGGLSGELADNQPPKTHSHSMSDISDHTSTATPHVSAANKTTWDGKIANVIEDTTPQLGGNLDGQTYNISTSGTLSSGEESCSGTVFMPNLKTGTSQAGAGVATGELWVDTTNNLYVVKLGR